MGGPGAAHVAIAKRTIDAHGGRIHAEPGPRAGMTMHVELPLESA
jgi:signal transduction histidine kinase